MTKNKAALVFKIKVHLPNAVRCTVPGQTGGVALLIGESHPLPELHLPHQGDVDTVGGGHRDTGDEPLEQGGGGLGEERLEPERSAQGGGGGGDVGQPHLGEVRGHAGVPVGVVDQGVE